MPGIPLVRPPVGSPIPVHATYEEDEKARRFWRASFRCGRDYLRGTDAFGLPVLVPHEREEQASYDRRRRLAKPRGFVGPILRRYNDLAFRKAPVRPLEGSPPIYLDVVEDATGQREPLDAVMRRALLLAQIDRESWVLLDRTGGDAPAAVTTVAQVKAAGVRPVIRVVEAPAVINWNEAQGGTTPIVSEVWVLMFNVAGAPVCRMFNETTYTDAMLKATEYARGTFVVEGYGPDVVHGYEATPLVRLRPCFDPLGAVGKSSGDSQAGPLAESQQAIVNLISLSREEVYNVTFSQMIAFGVSDAQVKDAQVGNNRVLCIPNPAGSVEMIGADPAQADSIRKEVADEVENLFRLAGVNPADASSAPASGLALAFRHNDLATIVAALAMACEQVEAAVWALLADAWGFEAPAPTVFQGKDPELPDFGTEAGTMLAVVANAALPPTIRRKVAERFAARNLSLDAAELAALAGEVAQGSAAARAQGPGDGAFPARPGDDEGAIIPAGKLPSGAVVPEKMQDAAMNGAQVASLVELLAAIAEQTLAPEAAVLAIVNAFPTITEQEARRMVAAQAKVEPPPAPVPFGGAPPAKEEEDPEDMDEDDEEEDEPKPKPGKGKPKP